jgi:hypothetical protein
MKQGGTGEKQPAKKIHPALPSPKVSKTQGSTIVYRERRGQKGQNRGWTLFGGYNMNARAEEFH